MVGATTATASAAAAVAVVVGVTLRVAAWDRLRPTTNTGGASTSWGTSLSSFSSSDFFFLVVVVETTSLGSSQCSASRIFRPLFSPHPNQPHNKTFGKSAVTSAFFTGCIFLLGFISDTTERRPLFVFGFVAVSSSSSASLLFACWIPAIHPQENSPGNTGP